MFLSREIILLFGFGFIFNHLILKSCFKFFKNNLLDNPNNRSLHIDPTPRGGGIGFIIPIFIFNFLNGLFFSWNTLSAISICTLPVLFISLLDDKFDVPNKYRYFFQLFSAILILRFTNPQLDFTDNLIFYAFSIISVTAVINFTNFMDGSDGLVALCMVIIFIFLAMYLKNFPGNFILIGSLVNFLFWNWYPSKIFMGDIGSVFLGIYFTGNLLQLDSLIEITGFFCILMPIYGDAIYTLCLRFLYGHNIFKAHKLHIYQRLFLNGISKQKIALLYALMTLINGLIYINFGLLFGIVTAFANFLILLYFDKKYALPFLNSKI